jgi:hypothetical protein
MKIIKWNAVLLFCVVTCLYAEETPDIVKSVKNMKIIETVEGNFISRSVKDNIYIIEDDRYITGYEKEKPLTMAYFIYGKYRYLPVDTLGYSDNYIRIINNIKKSYNDKEVKMNCIVGDFNKNGLDEIIFFELTGMSFEVKIVEFNGSDFKIVLDTRSLENIQRIEYQEIKGLPGFIVGNRKKIIGYQWNKKYREYIQVK